MPESKYAKYFVTEDLMPPQPPASIKAMEDQAKEGRILDRTMLLGIQDSIVPGCSLFAGCEILWGLPGGKPVSIEIPHSHDFDEVIGFGGTNRNYPRDLGGEIEFVMGGETHIITKTCLIFVPKGVSHCPVTFTRIDTPIFMFEAANNPAYVKVMQNRQSCEEVPVMEFTYETIAKYMNEYFETFNTYGQNPETIHRMDAFFAPDFEFLPYVATIPKVVGREEWYKVLLSHPSGYEKLTPEDMVIDERRKVVVMLIKAEIIDPPTREILVTKRYFARYPLVLDENNTIKIKKLQFFWEVLAPGAMEIDDVFDRDRKK